MNNEKPKDGGPAFPNVFVDQSTAGVRHTIVVDGMSLRDWFAGNALKSILDGSHSFEDAHVMQHRGKWARLTYEIADAMLAERQKDHK